MAGYLLVPNGKVPDTYNAGFSRYVAAWPLLDQYPGQRFQTGLFGTWMFAWKEPAPPIRLYSDIEGGLGWWRDTEYATETPKFVMGGVAPSFSEWANGPGAGRGREHLPSLWDKRRITARASHHFLQEEGALGCGVDLVRRWCRGQRRQSS
ncbi:MAG: hypothetical protein KA354_23325 [Phycisphaerae bacterium]|nr:hypothetical protein [Phycisphaerae bacterium]